MKQPTPIQQLAEANKKLAEQDKQIHALRNAAAKLSKMIHAVDQRARRAETNARNATNDLNALKRKLGK